MAQGNRQLGAAKSAKNDEFYTQYGDISKEVNAYLEFDPDTFRGKSVLLPCDDPEWSKFTRFFAENFERLGLKRLVSTSYAAESKRFRTPYQPSLFELEAPQFDRTKTAVKGKIFILDHDTNANGRIDLDDLEWRYLEGDGDFRSPEVRALRDEADVIVTNPPFSLFREFLAWIFEAGKQCLVIANKNCITYKEVFPLIKNNELWVGRTPMSEDLLFEIPKFLVEAFVQGGKEGSKYKLVDGKVYGRSTSIWVTNLEHGRRHQPLQLMTMAENLKYSRHKEIRGRAYRKYDNYDAIEVPYTDAIPGDYEGAMGVPISFLDKYCPEQFEILGITDRGNEYGLKTREYTEVDTSNANDLNRRGALLVDGVLQSTYARILIRAKR